MRRLTAAAFGVTAPCVRTLKNVLNNEGSLFRIQRGCEVARNVVDYVLSSGVALSCRVSRFWGLLGGSRLSFWRTLLKPGRGWTVGAVALGDRVTRR
ncbi:hypothetical protein AVEN_68932-1 [Araneus ventricosus]|uniref:Uncharacterized protein n=1 Tax=Araneus ventricosus TaxID=182803 RepID=A0A4Y2HI45_ARAVE|nr:hypothetical protein AVEN_68932-1 [Araneus ventricosus]